MMNRARAEMRLIVVMAVACLPFGAARAQGIGKETLPGGVEAKPSMPDMMRSVPGAAVPQAAPAPTMASPPVAAPKPVAPVPPKPAASPKRDGDDDAAPQKKSKKKAAAPKVMTRSISPGEAPAPAAVPGLPTVGGDESKPGAVERLPGSVAPQQ